MKTWRDKPFEQWTEADLKEWREGEGEKPKRCRKGYFWRYGNNYMNKGRLVFRHGKCVKSWAKKYQDLSPAKKSRVRKSPQKKKSVGRKPASRKRSVSRKSPVRKSRVRKSPQRKKTPVRKASRYRTANGCKKAGMVWRTVYFRTLKDGTVRVSR